MISSTKIKNRIALDVQNLDKYKRTSVYRNEIDEINLNRSHWGF